MQRRQFVCLAAGSVAVGAFAAHLASGGREDAGASSSDSMATLPTPAGDNLIAVNRTARAFGSKISITVLHADPPTARDAVDAAFGELALIEQLMSVYRDDSQLSRLNRDGYLDDPHPYLVRVLQFARQTSRQTNGAFDITVQPLWRLFDTARAAGRLPSEGEIAAARGSVDWQCVEATERRVRLVSDRRPAITLNGIAQGFAADRVMAALAERGIENALVNTGELSVRGHGRRGDAWSVGIQHPRQPDGFLSLARLTGRCLATSGDYATTFSADRRHHHIFDPRTGQSPTELASVSVLAPTAMAADALSTAAMVLGLEASLPILADLPDTDALYVDKQGREHRTVNFPCSDHLPNRSGQVSAQLSQRNVC